jgi:CelD/BcsL family acetyltransferase involved in cellulose biosynthesis
MLQVRSHIFRIPAEADPLRLFRPDALGSREQQAWDELGTEAEVPSVFAEPWLMRRSLSHCDPRHEARLAVVADEAGRWLGVLPIMPTRRQGRSPMPAWKGWRHANQFVGSPLVRRGQADRFWRGLLEGLGAHGGRVSLVLGDLPVDDPVTEALLRICAQRDRAIVVDRCIARACLRVGASPEQCAKQRSRIRGLERKLASEVGAVTFELVCDAGFLDRFLALEQSGWKGRAGSAIACAEGTRGFFDDACRAAAATGRLEVAILSAGGRIVAISTQLEGATWRYGFKAAYDEAFARYAPGLLLLDRLTKSYIERGDLDVDSCAVPDQQPVSRLWSGRRELIDCRVALGGAVRSRLFAAMVACERVARGMRADG